MPFLNPHKGFRLKNHGSSVFQTQRRRVAALHKGAYCAYPERTSGTGTVIKTGRRQKSARAGTVSLENVPKQKFALELVRKNGKNNRKK